MVEESDIKYDEVSNYTIDRYIIMSQVTDISVVIIWNYIEICLSINRGQLRPMAFRKLCKPNIRSNIEIVYLK